jgi:hypothetical protein
MRWLTKQLEGQPREEHDNRGESGAVLIFVAISLVVLLGSVAMSVDFGRMYSERRELQNGADAAALAVAQDCAAGDCGGAYSPYPIAEEYADANASDGLAWVNDIDLDLAAQTVTVHTATEDPGGDHFFDMMFAQIVGYDGLTVNAQATVAWGAPRGGSVFPIIFSICEWQHFKEELGYLHPSSAVPLMPPNTGYSRQAEFSTILLGGSEDPYDPPCHDSPSGKDIEGGFGWIGDKGLCLAEIDDEDWVKFNNGKDSCDRTLLLDLVGTVQVIPYYDDLRNVGGPGDNEYHVAGLGAFYITGFRFPGIDVPSVIPGEENCPGPSSTTCVQGYFIADWFVSSGGEIGGGDFGVTVVKFIG